MTRLQVIRTKKLIHNIKRAYTSAGNCRRGKLIMVAHSNISAVSNESTPPPSSPPTPAVPTARYRASSVPLSWLSSPPAFCRIRSMSVGCLPAFPEVPIKVPKVLYRGFSVTPAWFSSPHAVGRLRSKSVGCVQTFAGVSGFAPAEPTPSQLCMDSLAEEFTSRLFDVDSHKRTEKGRRSDIFGSFEVAF
jgi:hypothetical protein